MKAIDYADYIVKKTQALNQTVTHLQLQQILFLIAAEYQRTNATYPFNPAEKFEAWGYGPVMPSVYQMYHHYELMPIETYQHSIFDYQTYQWKVSQVNENNLDATFKNIVDQSLAQLLQINVFKLVWYNHQQPFWINRFKS